MKKITNAHYTKRWNGQFIVGHRRSISEHSFEVAMVSREICREFYSMEDWILGQCLELSLLHDLAELTVCDVPYTVKRDNKELSDNLYSSEQGILSKDYGKNESDFSTLCRFIVRCSDISVAAMEIRQEVKLGNMSECMLSVCPNRESEAMNIMYSDDKTPKVMDSNIWDFCVRKFMSPVSEEGNLV